MAGWLGRREGDFFITLYWVRSTTRRDTETVKQEEEEEATKSDSNKKRSLTNRVLSTVLIFFLSTLCLEAQKRI